MRSIKLPEPPGSNVTNMPEIFDRGISCVVRRAVIIGNGAPGAEHQCLGLINALGLSENVSLFRVNRPKGSYNRWLRWLPVIVHKKLDSIIQYIQFDLRYMLWSRLVKGTESVPMLKEREAFSFVPEADARKIAALASQDVEREGPLLVVASGRDTASIAATVKRLAAQETFVVQIQLPRRGLDRYDMVITPKHDYHALTPAASQEVPKFILRWISPQHPPDKHVVLTTGALHHADTMMLRVAAARWHAELAPLLKPILVVNIGGPTRHCNYGYDLALELVSALKMVLATCGSVRLSFSQRTPSKIAAYVRSELSSYSKVYIWDGQGPNPHLGHLAWADAFVVTADSISMLSEACSTGKPVYVIGAEKCKWKFAAFHKSLRLRGLVRSFTGVEDMSESWSYPPLDDNVEAASRVRQAIAEHGWSISKK